MYWLFFFISVGSLLGRNCGGLSLALFFMVRVPGGAVGDGVDLLGVRVELHVVLLGGSQSSAETQHDRAHF